MHYVIYVPGLGDNNLAGQKAIVTKWRWFGVTPKIVPMIWNDGEKFVDKLARLTSAIDDLASKGTVSLVGVSAGGSAVINALASCASKIHKIILICAEVNPNITINPKIARDNPAFVESINILGGNLASLNASTRSKIRSYHPLIDETVPVKDTKIDGAKSKLLLSFSHAPTIALAISLISPIFLHWLKK